MSCCISIYKCSNLTLPSRIIKFKLEYALGGVGGDDQIVDEVANLVQVVVSEEVKDEMPENEEEDGMAAENEERAAKSKEEKKPDMKMTIKRAANEEENKMGKAAGFSIQIIWT